MPRITTECANCGKSIFSYTLAPDRGELAKEKGEKLELKCRHCGNTGRYHVDTIECKPNRWLLFTVSVAAVVATYLIIWLAFDFQANRYVMSAILMIPLVTYFVMKRIMNNTAVTFNSYYLRSDKKNPAHD